MSAGGTFMAAIGGTESDEKAHPIPAHPVPAATVVHNIEYPTKLMNDLPRIISWADYSLHAHKKYEIPDARISPLRNDCKWIVRRIYRVVSLNNAIPKGYWKLVKNVTRLIFIVLSGVFAALQKTYDPDTADGSNIHIVTISSIFYNILIVFTVLITLDLLDLIYLGMNMVMRRTERNEVQRRLWDDYEEFLELKMNVFFSRGDRFDSGVDDARAAFQVIWGDYWIEATGGSGPWGAFRRFFILGEINRSILEKKYERKKFLPQSTKG